jgi:hypothetical protein
MPESSDRRDRARSAQNGKSAPVWKAALGAVERPVSRAAQTWMQSDTFMDGFAITWRLQRRVEAEVRRGLDVWLQAWQLPTRTDVHRLSNEIAGLERQVRDLRGELEQAGHARDATDPILPQLGQTSRRRPANRGRR